MAVQGVQLLYVPWPGQTVVLGPAEGTLLTVLVVVVTVNAVNFVDGLDGLAAGIVGIASAAFFLFAYLLSVQNDLVRATPAALVTAVLDGDVPRASSRTTSTRPGSSWGTAARC